MTVDNNLPQDNSAVEVVAENSALVSSDSRSGQELQTEGAIVLPTIETESLKAETKALLEAIQTKAFSEAQKAGEFARENYLESVRKAREQVENLNLFDPDRIESAIQQLQSDVEKDWENVVKQANDFGDRLGEAAKTAWEILTQPKAK